MLATESQKCYKDSYQDSIQSYDTTCSLWDQMTHLTMQFNKCKDLKGPNRDILTPILIQEKQTEITTAVTETIRNMYLWKLMPAGLREGPWSNVMDAESLDTSERIVDQEERQFSEDLQDHQGTDNVKGGGREKESSE